MMNQEIISTRLLLISTVISTLFLIYITFAHNLKGNSYISFCNKENKINILIKLNGKDYLINPIGKKEIQECLSEYLPYYDRTIDVLVSDNDTMIHELTNRYTVGRIVSSRNLRINDITIELSNNVVMENKNRSLIIYQTQLKDISKELISKNTDITIIKPFVEESSSKLAIFNQKTIYNLKKNELLNLNLFRAQ